MDCFWFPQFKTCYMFSNKSKCSTASVDMSNACLSLAPCQQHISDSHFATGLWQVCSLAAAAKGSLLTAFLLVLLKLVLIVSLHCLFQAHLTPLSSSSRLPTLEQARHSTAFLLLLLFFLAGTRCLILRPSAALQGGFFPIWWCTEQFQTIDLNLLPLCTLFLVQVPEQPPTKQQQGSAPLHSLKCGYYKVLSLLSNAAGGEDGLCWCVRRCCANTQIPVPHGLP